MSGNLGDYTIFYSGGIGSAPSRRKFSDLGITSAKFVSVGGGGDYADLTVAASVNAPGMPFVPLARHAIYDPSGVLRFVGWLLTLARRANSQNQEQTFRLAGPNYLLANLPFLQPWNFAVAPTDYNSAITPQMIPHVLLNRQDYAANTRVDVAGQIKEVLDFAIAAGVPIRYGGLAAIPTVQPPEDEQTDLRCDAVIFSRQLRWTPKVTAYWSYPATVPLKPQLNFIASDAVPASAVSGGDGGTVGGGLHPDASGIGIISIPGSTGVLIDPDSESLSTFSSDARYDLLVKTVTIYYVSEQEVTDDGSATGTRKVWAVLGTDVSTVNNGALRELSFCIDLRGAGGPRDPATGLAQTPQEFIPTGLAAAVHEPFKVLTHSLQWSIVDEDVDWDTHPGLAVGVRNAGDDLLAGARSIIQQVTRDIGTGTTTYQAGPPAQLGLDDLVSLTRFTRARNSARNGGGSGGGGYSRKGGPYQKDTGLVLVFGGGGDGGGGALGPNWIGMNVRGYGAFALANIATPTTEEPPTGVINPEGVPGPDV